MKTRTAIGSNTSNGKLLAAIGMICLSCLHAYAVTTYTALIMRTTMTDKPPTATAAAINSMTLPTRGA